MTYLKNTTLIFLLLLLSISEMLALTNWALSKPTFQSSTFGEFLSYRAVDGNVDGDIFQGGCSHTRSQADPWWVVDLGQRITVTNVTVVNRVDCCGERLYDYDIGVTDTPPSSQTPSPSNYDLCHHVVGVALPVATITCDSVIRGRYVIIQIAGSQEWLTLCEVEVYDSSAMLYPDFVMDGDNGTCALTEYSSSVYWEVVMAESVDIASIKLTIAFAAIQSVEIIVAIGSENTRHQNFTMCSRQVIEEFDDRVIMDITLACDTWMKGQKVSMTFRGINLWLGKLMQVQICELLLM